MPIEDAEVRLTLRLPARLRDAILLEASKSGRSLNGEIVHRLERAMSDDNSPEKIWAAIDDIEGKVSILWAIYNGKDPYNVDK